MPSNSKNTILPDKTEILVNPLILYQLNLPTRFCAPQRIAALAHHPFQDSRDAFVV
jgi:hypothetical protein